MTGACLLVARFSLPAAIALLVVGASAAAVRAPAPRWAAAATVAAAAPALAPSDVAVWLLPVCAVAVSALPRNVGTHTVGSVEALHAHLDRARRRAEPVHVLYAGSAGGGEFLSVDAAEAILRTSDSMWLHGRGRAQDLVAVLDARNLDREGVERRLAAAATGPLVLGWAVFPADGHGLDRLVEHAMADARGIARTSA